MDEGIVRTCENCKYDVVRNSGEPVPCNECRSAGKWEPESIINLKEELLEEADKLPGLGVTKVVEIWQVKQNGFQAEVIFGVAGLERIEMSGIRIEGAVTADKLLFLGKVGQEIQRIAR